MIKNGKNSASIEIVLSNLGVRAYKYEVYGNEITVVRNLTHTSSNYRIKEASGKLVHVHLMLFFNECLLKLFVVFHIYVFCVYTFFLKLV